MYVIVKVMMVRVDLVMPNPVARLIQAQVARLMRVKAAHVMQNQEVLLIQGQVARLMRVKVVPVMRVKVANAIQGLGVVGLARQFVLSVIRYYKISLDSDLNSGCVASRNHSKRTDSVFNNHTSDCSNLVSAVS